MFVFFIVYIIMWYYFISQQMKADKPGKKNY